MTTINPKNKISFPYLAVGVDISKDKHCSRVMYPDRSVSTPFSFTNDRTGFEAFNKHLHTLSTTTGVNQVVIGMEPTSTYYQPLEQYLAHKGYTTVLVMPQYVKNEKNKLDNSPTKSDPKDAHLIAKLVHEGSFLVPAQADEERRTIQNYVELLERIDTNRTQAINHLESFLARRFPEFGRVFRSISCASARAVLETYPFPARLAAADEDEVVRQLWQVSRGKVNREKSKQVLQAARDSVGVPGENIGEEMSLRYTLEQLASFEQTRKQVKKELSLAIRRSSVYRILASIPGFGPQTIAALLGAVGDLGQYRTARQVWKKAGLNLTSQSSGRYRGKVRISKRGDSRLRRVLYMAATTHARQSGYWYVEYQGMRARGVRHTAAVVALMRRMLKVAFALVRDGRVFEDRRDISSCVGGTKSTVSRQRQALAV